MIELSSKQNCTGCSACANICPRGCIRMNADEEGFLYPKVNEEMCMDCGLCENVCPMLHKPKQHELLAVYGAKNNDDAVRFTSSSGGMFTLFAEEPAAGRRCGRRSAGRAACCAPCTRG